MAISGKQAVIEAGRMLMTASPIRVAMRRTAVPADRLQE
jgi:hypothetical protein